MQKRKVSDSVPHVKSRGAKLPKPAPAQLGMGDPSDYSAGHDQGSGAAAPATSHKGPATK
jgi:hypothetical protein